MDRKQKKEFLIIAVGLLVLLSCMSFLLRSCSNQKAKQAQQRISTQQKIKQDKKEESTEKADTKKIVSSEASHVQEEQLPNTGSAESQAALAAGLALLGLSAGLVATKGKKED